MGNELTVKKDSGTSIQTLEGWTGILNGIATVLGPIASMYANTLSYRIECKRLDVKMLEIRKQSKIIHKKIDNDFKLEMMKLETRRKELVSAYTIISKQLEDLHVERMKVLEMAENCNKKLLKGGLSEKEMDNFKELVIELTKQLPLFGDRANESLKNLIQALPPINLPKQITYEIEE